MKSMKDMKNAGIGQRKWSVTRKGGEAAPLERPRRASLSDAFMIFMTFMVEKRTVPPARTEKLTMKSMKDMKNARTGTGLGK